LAIPPNLDAVAVAAGLLEARREPPHVPFEQARHRLVDGERRDVGPDPPRCLSCQATSVIAAGTHAVGLERRRATRSLPRATDPVWTPDTSDEVVRAPESRRSCGAPLAHDAHLVAADPAVADRQLDPSQALVGDVARLLPP
jgi:hypothetical protein